ncbi:MAG TPA: TspO/MBR family protein [Verrucomicrobiae bacterium]|nr:TspO/MBR family protein [Verrucomicrobiae bacterium]
MKSIPRFLIFLTICLGIGWAGGMVTASSVTTWYGGLTKPPLNPPNAIFAPVWTSLYVLMAAAGARLWTGVPSARFLFVLQLILNGAWSFLFFGMRNPAIAMIDILALWICLFLLISAVRHQDKVSALLFLPYLAWVSFAGYLNGAIWYLNP